MTIIKRINQYFTTINQLAICNCKLHQKALRNLGILHGQFDMSSFLKEIHFRFAIATVEFAKYNSYATLCVDLFSKNPSNH